MRNLPALAVLLLACFGSPAWAGYCVQIAAVPMVQVRNGNPVNVNLIVPVAVQPSDMSTCALVLVAGAEWANLTLMSAGWSGLNSQVSLNTTNITGLRTDVNAARSDISALRTDVNTLRVDVNNQVGATTGIQSSMSTVLNYQSQSFDLTVGMAAFAFFFSTVLFFYGVARSAGAILETIRKPLGH